MVNPKDENKKLKEGTENVLDQQKQQLENTTSTISETTNRVNDNINEYQRTNRESIDTTNRYQQETINTIQSISNNYLELQKNIANTFHSGYSRFLDNISNNKSYWNNFLYPQRYTDADNKTNQSITDNTIIAYN